MITGFWSNNFIWLILSIICMNQFKIPTFQTNQNVNEFNFVVYSNHPFYGMNIDNNRGEIRFRIATEHKHRVLFFDILESGIYRTFAGVNDQGIFISSQDLVNQVGINPLSNNEFENIFGEILYNQSFLPSMNKINIEDFQYFINNSIVLFGDIRQNAYYIETIDNISRLVTSSNPYLISSPYLISNQETLNSNSINDSEINYQNLISSLEERQSNFSVLNGFKALDAASFSTNQITSIVVEPNQNKIYISFDKDFEKLWMINLDGLTIETFSGFDKYHKGNVPKIGITSNDLRILNFSNEGLMKGVIIGATSIFLILMIPEIVSLIKILRNKF